MIWKPRYRIILLALIFVFTPTRSERIITNADIARWYLDADLVVIASLIEQETIQLGFIDSAGTNGYSTKCNLLKDKYIVQIDSILKGCSSLETINISTPEYSIDCYNYKINKSSETNNSESGDTSLLTSFEIVPLDFDAGSYYRIDCDSVNIFFLKKETSGYESMYVMHGLKDENLKLLHEVDTWGEKYFNKYKDQ